MSILSSDVCTIFTHTSDQRNASVHIYISHIYILRSRLPYYLWFPKLKSTWKNHLTITFPSNTGHTSDGTKLLALEIYSNSLTAWTYFKLKLSNFKNFVNCKYFACRQPTHPTEWPLQSTYHLNHWVHGIHLSQGKV